MKNGFIIYRHRSLVSGKEYVGFTNWGMERRWLRHVELAQAGSKTHFHAAIRKYGPGAWEHEILSEAATADEAKALERAFIERLDTYNNGYNSTFGGDGSAGHKWRPDRKADFKIRFSGEGNPFFGKAHKPEVVEGMKKMLSERRATGWCPRKGRTHSEETKKKISEKKKGQNPYRENPPPTKDWYVAIHPCGTQELIYGMREFSGRHNLNPGNISNCLAGRYHSTQGFRFRHAVPEEIEAGCVLREPPPNDKGKAHEQQKVDTLQRRLHLGEKAARLRWEEDLTYVQIAERLNISEASVRRCYHAYERALLSGAGSLEKKSEAGPAELGPEASFQLSFEF